MRSKTPLWFGVLTALAFGLPALIAWRLSPDHPKYDLAIFLGTGLVVLWYTLETSRMRLEMEAARRRLETPNVLVRLDHSRAGYLGFFDVIIENSSGVPAYQVTFTKVPDFPLAPGNRRTANIGFLKHGVSYLGPMQSERAYFLAYKDLTDEQRHSTITFEYSFKTLPQGQPIRRSVSISLGSYDEVSMIGFAFHRELINELKSLNQNVDQVARILANKGGV